MNHTTFDVIIAGGGLSGILTAARLSEAQPEIKTLVLEKDKALGGRLRTNGAVDGRWSCGLNGVTPDLHSFASQSFSGTEDALDLHSFVNEAHIHAGILSGGKFSTIEFSDIFESHGARKLGGMAAQRAWENVTNLLDRAEKKKDESPGHKTLSENSSSDSETSTEGSSNEFKNARNQKSDKYEMSSQPLGKIWKHTRKNAAAIVMEHFAYSFGIPDIWQANLESLSQRADSLKNGLITGSWESAFTDLLERYPLSDSITLKTDCTVIEARQTDDLWKVETEQGEVVGRNLVVAQDPWQALAWLPKEFWPVSMLDFTLKTKPVSLVALTCEIDTYVDLPDLTFVLSERVQVSVKNKKEICFRAPLDFEISLDAPEVVKAIKRLRRAKKKLAASIEGLVIGGEHLKLLPIAWPQSTAHADHRHIKKFEKKGTVSDKIAFCGDAYGSSYVGDENIQTSIIGACDHILSQFHRGS